MLRVALQSLRKRKQNPFLPRALNSNEVVPDRARDGEQRKRRKQYSQPGQVGDHAGVQELAAELSGE